MQVRFRFSSAWVGCVHDLRAVGPFRYAHGLAQRCVRVSLVSSGLAQESVAFGASVLIWSTIGSGLAQVWRRVGLQDGSEDVDMASALARCEALAGLSACEDMLQGVALPGSSSVAPELGKPYCV